MREDIFINNALDIAFKYYLSSTQDKDSILYNSFYVVVIRILILIYGEENILKLYNEKNSVAFINYLSKYGMSKTDIALFKEDFLNYYNFEVENDKRKIKIPNPYFKVTLKYLIDMFVAKKINAGVPFQDEEKFLELAYTTHTKEFYRISYGYLMDNDALENEKYYYSKLNELDVTRDLGTTISENLNLKALEYVGVGLSQLKDMNSNEINIARNKAYDYFDIDFNSPTRDEELKDSLKGVNLKNVTTGNGYVDILLLMSVIATSFSILAIIIFSVM